MKITNVQTGEVLEGMEAALTMMGVVEDFASDLDEVMFFSFLGVTVDTWAGKNDKTTAETVEILKELIQAMEAVHDELGVVTF